LIIVSGLTKNVSSLKIGLPSSSNASSGFVLTDLFFKLSLHIC
jgi:hypothetical protein